MLAWFKSLWAVRARRSRVKKDRLFERVCDEGEDLLVLVEEEHDTEVAETFIGEAGAGDEFETLDLAKVGG